MPAIADLIADGRIERVVADDREAFALLEHADLHLQSAKAILDTDVAGAYQLLYDAARKAIAAHMSASGLRAKSDRPGAHAAVAAYAGEALAGAASTAALQRFDGMRRLRNRAEYGGLTLGRAQAEADLEHATEIVQGVAKALRRTR